MSISAQANSLCSQSMPGPTPSCRGSPFVPVAVAPVAKRVQLDFMRSQIRFPAGILRILFAYNSQTPGQSAGLGGVRAEGWLNQPAHIFCSYFRLIVVLTHHTLSFIF